MLIYVEENDHNGDAGGISTSIVIRNQVRTVVWRKVEGKSD